MTCTHKLTHTHRNTDTLTHTQSLFGCNGAVPSIDGAQKRCIPGHSCASAVFVLFCLVVIRVVTVMNHRADGGARLCDVIESEDSGV